ncbi:CBO0543 family protein [Orenia marismortui]|uniref:CBO0543 family protein n=1 Tax=Orenia marismortui TaxID=46469 RepID=UPI000366F804|nr:CBO0543 family protein [Orenia marismortui]
MAFSITLFIISWLVFLKFADRSKFFEYSPTCYIAMILGLMTDILVHHYPFWKYTAAKKPQIIIRHYLDDLGVYFVVTYLFIQCLPKTQKTFNMLIYIFGWTVIAVLIEAIALKLTGIEHGLGWNLIYSYLSDWLLFLIFYAHYRLRTKYSNKVESLLKSDKQ